MVCWNRETEAAGQLSTIDLGQAERGGGGDPAVHVHQVQPRGTLPGSGEHVQPQDGY